MADTPKPQDAQRTENRAAGTVKEAADTAQQAAREGAQTAHDATQRAAEAGREGFNRMAGEAQRFASRAQEMNSQAITAYAEAGKRASSALGDVNKGVTDLYSQTLADFDELSRQAIGVKSVTDALDLQNVMLRKFQDQMNAMTRIYSLYVGAVSQSMEPLAKQASQATRQFGNAAA